MRRFERWRRSSRAPAGLALRELLGQQLLKLQALPGRVSVVFQLCQAGRGGG